MASLAVVILTYNEQRHIRRAIETVQSIAQEIFVIDSYSTDKTIVIAKSLGAVVLENEFINQAKQFEWGLDNAPITARWIMRLDADEIVEPDLVSEIDKNLSTLGDDIVGINLRRKHVFMDRWIRHGGRFPITLLRIWRRGQGRVEQRWMDEHIVVWGGKIVTFKGGFSDYNLNDLTYFTDKHNKYATREAIEVINQKYNLFERDTAIATAGAVEQASIKRLMKEKLYNRLPFWLGPLSYFIYRYIGQLGFLDGYPGLIYHFLQGGWYRFLVGAKVVEYEFALKRFETRSERICELERLTGHKLLG